MPYGTLNTDTITSSTGNLSVTGNIVPTGGFYASNTPGINRIINGAMNIDQRNNGSSQTITAAAALAYTVDRWYAYCTGANVTGQRVANTGTSAAPSQYAYQFTGAASVTAIGFAQRIEAVNCYDLANTTATLSVNLSNSLLTTVTWTAYYANTADTFGTLASPTKTQIATGTFTVSSTMTRYSTQITVPSAATTGIEIVFSVGAQTSGTWVIGNAQLEAGSMMSVFERRLYENELANCQRYCQQLAGANPWAPAGIGVTWSTTQGSMQLSLPTPMRVTPSITTAGTIISQVGSITVSSWQGPWGPGANSSNLLDMDFTLASATTNNTIVFFRFFNQATRSFLLTAEL